MRGPARDAIVTAAISIQNTAFSTPSIPTLRTSKGVTSGHVDPAQGWFDVDYLGIDQGPIVRDDRKPSQRPGLENDAEEPSHRARPEAAGFMGGWLEEATAP